jgi:hypothetical protein
VVLVAPTDTIQIVLGNAVVFVLVRATGAPPSGAGPVKVTVTFAFAPPVTEPGEIVTDAAEGTGATKAMNEFPAVGAAVKPGLSVI